MAAQILLLDIETAPSLGHIWKLWDENIPLARLLKSGYMLCYSAKWYQQDQIYFDSLYESSPKALAKGIHKLLNDADAVVHYNGKRFDIPHINSEIVRAGLKPPSPFKQIDLLTTVRNRFKFPSNKLEYVVKELGIGIKSAPTYDVWKGCMNDDEESWAAMQEYNINDTILLEKLYTYLRPWINNHPNLGIYQDESLVCPACTSTHYHKRGVAVTKACRYQRFQCSDCGHWFRATTPREPKAGAKFSSI